MVAELIALLSTQGIGLVITGVLLFGVIKGIPKFFKWIGLQWEDLKNVFKNYMGEQVSTMKEIRDSNREIMSENRKLVDTVLNITGKVDVIEGKVDTISEDIKIIKEKVEER